MTPGKKKPAVKVPGLKETKDVKEIKTSKAPKLNPLKPAPSMPFKGLTKLAQYSYNKSSSIRNAELKPPKPPGIGKFVVEASGAKQ